MAMNSKFTQQSNLRSAGTTNRIVHTEGNIAPVYGEKEEEILITNRNCKINSNDDI